MYMSDISCKQYLLMLNKGLLPWSYFSRFLLPRPFLYESFSKYVYAWDTIKSDSDNNADWNQWDRLQNVTIKALCTSWISDLPWIFEWAQEENNRNERKSSFPSRAGSFGAPNPKEWYRRSELKTTQTHCVSKKTIRRGHQFTPPLDETLGSLVKTKQKKNNSKLRLSVYCFWSGRYQWSAGKTARM